MPTPGSPEDRFPELFNHTEEDPRTRKRDREMHVLVIGMMRTGTMSIKTALHELGYKGVYHMVSVMKNPADSGMWKEAADAKYFGKGKPYTREDWDHLLGHCEACIDIPPAAFMPELITAYPNAKVIVAQRDVEKWWQSLRSTVLNNAAGSSIFYWVGLIDPFLLGRWGPMLESMMTGMFGKDPASRPEHVKAVYNAMHDEVRAMVPKERLLEYRLGDDWEPLCRFLGKEVPEKPFPRINETAEFAERIQIVMKLAMRRAVWNAAPWVVGAGALGAAWYFGLRG